jgi:hypothetical protein
MMLMRRNVLDSEPTSHRDSHDIGTLMALEKCSKGGVAQGCFDSPRQLLIEFDHGIGLPSNTSGASCCCSS